MYIDYIVNDKADARGNLAPIHLAFIDQFRLIQPNASLFYVNSCGSRYCATMHNLLRWISTSQNIPLLSFYDVIQCSSYISQDNGQIERDVWHSTTRFHIHPPWQTHDLVAYTYSFIFFKNIKRINTLETSENPPKISSPKPEISGLKPEISGLKPDISCKSLVINTVETYRLYNKSDLVQYQTCTHPLTHYSAGQNSDPSPPPLTITTTPNTTTNTNNNNNNDNNNNNNNNNTPIQSYKWPLTEDRKGKPGWISEAYNSYIKFPMTFGPHPSLTFSYLKSYQGLGIYPIHTLYILYFIYCLYCIEYTLCCSVLYFAIVYCILHYLLHIIAILYLYIYYTLYAVYYVIFYTTYDICYV